MDDDKTIILSPPSAVRVRVQQGNSWQNERRFTDTFRIGRSSTCQLQLPDRAISKEHCEIKFEAGRWRIRDLESANGTYLNGRRITQEVLPPSGQLELGRGGPILWVKVGEGPWEQELMESIADFQAPSSVTQVIQHYLAPTKSTGGGEHTMMIRRAFDRISKQRLRRYKVTVSIIAVFLIAAGSLAVYQHQKLNSLKAVAGDFFYDMKRIELQVAQLEELVMSTANAKQIQELRAKREKIKEMEARYDRFVDQLGIYSKSLNEEERSILRIARLFGECEATMPEGFVTEVQKYIQRWKSTDRLLGAIRRAETNGYTRKISDALIAQNLPPQFFYLALQESGFNSRAVGPPTRYGFAKGVWQFVPGTASQYGLRVGPLKETARYDPQDERHNFDKATLAAARYIKRLYTTEAQASGLLVMASYNWGEGNVGKIIRQMPENPKERNFWQLLKRYRIPRETNDYVFYIVAAAVIAENPKQFGFDFTNPFPRAMPRLATSE